MISVIVLVADVCQRLPARGSLSSPTFRQYRQAAHIITTANYRLGDPPRPSTAPRVINMPNRHHLALPNDGRKILPPTTSSGRPPARRWPTNDSIANPTLYLIVAQNRRDITVHTVTAAARDRR